MSRTNYGYLLLFCLVLFFAGCAEQDEGPLVDKTYLDSPEYSEFEENFTEESLYNKENNRSFTGYLKQLRNCEQLTDLSAPFQMSEEFFVQLQKGVSENCIVENNRKPSYSLKAIARNPFRGLMLYWIILDRPSVYRNQGIFIAAFREDSLVDYTAVGSVEKDLSKDIATDLEVISTENNNLLITSTTTRKLTYPFEQENETTEQYLINPEGDILIQ